MTFEEEQKKMNNYDFALVIYRNKGSFEILTRKRGFLKYRGIYKIELLEQMKEELESQGFYVVVAESCTR